MCLVMGAGGMDWADGIGIYFVGIDVDKMLSDRSGCSMY